MAVVTVAPQTFDFVDFDAAIVTSVTAALTERIGLSADLPVHVEIDERTPLGRVQVRSLDPLVLFVEGGALEDPTRPRQLSERLTADVIGRLLLRARDRLDPAFGEPPPDGELTLQQQTAWDTTCMGRLERLGYDVRRPRRLYHFRNRHGFSDAVDRVFERLWAMESPTWADVEAACAETAAARQHVA